MVVLTAVAVAVVFFVGGGVGGGALAACQEVAVVAPIVVVVAVVDTAVTYKSCLVSRPGIPQLPSDWPPVEGQPCWLCPWGRGTVASCPLPAARSP